MTPIKTISNFTYKSYRNYSGPENGKEFNTHKNIIFGANGQGKSSLCKYLEDEYKKTNQDWEENNSFRFFNSDYVKNNVLVEGEDDLINGVPLVYFEKDIKTKNIIDGLNSQKVDINQLQNTKKSLGRQLKNSIEKVFNKEKGSSQIRSNYSSSIPDDGDFAACMEHFESDWRDALKIEDQDENKVKNYSGTTSISEERDKIDKIQISAINKIDDATYKEMEDLFNKSFGVVNATSADIVAWLKEGLEVHQKNHSNKCLFCGGTPDFDKIQKTIDESTSKEKEAAISQINSFKSKLNTIVETINDFCKRKDYVSENIKTITDDEWDTLSNDASFVSMFINETIDAKLNDTDSPHSFDSSSLKEKVDEIYNIINSMRSKKAIRIGELEKSINNGNNILKGKIARAILDDSLINEQLERIKKNDEKISEGNKKNSELDKEIEKNKVDASNRKDFMESMNRCLSNLNINLKLSLDTGGNNYILKHSEEGIDLKVSDISEGEKNILALLYFYNGLFTDEKKEKLDDKIEMIIIDDPISSLDDANRVFIIELIKSLCGKATGKEIQIFILTHTWENFSEFFFILKKQNPNQISFWRITKSKGYSKIFLVNKDAGIATPYQHAFNAIYEASLLPEDEIDTTKYDKSIYSLPNLMRCFLETFLKNKTDDPNAIYNGTTLATILFSNQDEYTDTELAKARTLSGVCNIFSHEIPTTSSGEEIISSAKFLIERLQAIDKLHFGKLKKGYDDEKSQETSSS